MPFLEHSIKEEAFFVGKSANKSMVKENKTKSFGFQFSSTAQSAFTGAKKFS